MVLPERKPVRSSHTPSDQTSGFAVRYFRHLCDWLARTDRTRLGFSRFLMRHKFPQLVLNASRSRNSCSAVTLIQLLVVLLISAVLLLLALPTIKDGLAKREMNRTMINARELYLAGFRMATESAAKSDPSRAWPGDYETGVTSLADYCTKLVQGDYLKADDLQKILNAPGVVCHVTSAGSPPTVTLTGASALKVYKVKSTDKSETIFSVSSNYVYGTPLKPTDMPFGDKGFVVMRKRGDAGVYRKYQATVAGWGDDKAEFHSKIGKLAGAPDSVAGDGGAALTGP